MIEPIRDYTIQQDVHQKVLQSLQHIVLEETQGGRVIIRNLVSILNGDDPDARPSHRLQSARILLKLGFEEAREALRDSERRSGDAVQQDEELQDYSQSAVQHLNPEHEKVNKKLVARIRVDSEGGASIVRVLLDILEGNDPNAKTRDRIDAAKVLLHWGFANPAQPDPEFMMFYVPCHPDCLCVCKDLPEDHPDTLRAHTPPTQEQQEERAKRQEFMEKVAESAKRKATAEREWRLEQTYSPTAVDARRLEREERLKRRELKREQDLVHIRSP